MNHVPAAKVMAPSAALCQLYKWSGEMTLVIAFAIVVLA